MRLLRCFCLLALLGISVASQAQSGSESASNAIKSLLSGKSAPLSYKLKDLGHEWSSMKIGQTSNQQDYMQMVSSLFSGGGVFYTRGEIVKVGEAGYLVAYSAPSKKMDMAAMMAANRPDANMFKPEKLTADTTLTLSLLNAATLSNLNEIHPFDLDEELKRNEAEVNPPKVVDEKASRITSMSNLKQAALGAMMYIQDYDEVIPPLKSPEKFRSLLQPYVKNEEIFFVPGSEPKQPYLANASLSYHPLRDIANPAETVLFYAPKPDAQGLRVTAFADGHVKATPEADFQRLLKQSQLKLVSPAPPDKPKPKPPKKPSSTRKKRG